MEYTSVARLRQLQHAEPTPLDLRRMYNIWGKRTTPKPKHMTRPVTPPPSPVAAAPEPEVPVAAVETDSVHLEPVIEETVAVPEQQDEEELVVDETPVVRVKDLLSHRHGYADAL
jgi:hypothetical protein